MASHAPGDPRLEAAPADRGIAPVVARPRAGLSGPVLGVFALVAAILLFLLLDGRRRALEAPAVRPRVADTVDLAVAPPPLLVPSEAPPPPVMVVPEVSQPVVERMPAPMPMPRPEPQIIYVPQPMPAAPAMPVASGRASAEPAIVVDNGAKPAAPAAGGESGAGAASDAVGNAGVPGSGGRTRAGMFANRSTTVPQGTLIPAVLETAFDSSRPGFARAIVQRDIKGFDGTRVLIPRGSRLIGEYSATTATGQKRALVSWTRLIRPDGVTIAIGSPAADPLGRGGIKAKVNTHFIERFAGTILQSVLDIGVSAASSRLGNGTVVVALPGAASTVGQTIQPQQIQPTLKVAAGRSISVFVARDLDFTAAEARR